MRHSGKNIVDIGLTFISMILQIVTVMIATKISGGLNLIQILIVVGVTRALYITVKLTIERKKVDDLFDDCKYEAIPSKAVDVIITSLISGIGNAIVVGVMFKLLSLIVDASSIYLINCSIVLGYLLHIVPLVLNTIFEEKDESNINLCIEIVDSVKTKFIKTLSIKEDKAPSSVYGGMMGYGGMGGMNSSMGMAGGIVAGKEIIFNTLEEISRLLVRIKDMTDKYSAQDREVIKNQLEFILEDFENIYNRYGALQITTNRTIFGKYTEYLKYVTDGIKDLEEKIIDNKLDTLDSAVNKLKSFSELNNLEDKYK